MRTLLLTQRMHARAQWERWSSGATRLMYSPAYAWVYGILGLVCIGMFVWSVTVQ